MMQSFNVSEGDSIDFEMFKRVFADYYKSGNVFIDERTKSLQKKASQFSLRGTRMDDEDTYIKEGKEDKPSVNSPFVDRYNDIANRIRRHEQYYFWLFLYTLVMICVFVERFYVYL